MSLLVDTHIFVWWVENNPKLSEEQARKLEEAGERGERVNLSVMTLWEIAKLVSLDRLEVSRSLDQWFGQIEEDPRLNVLPLSGRIVLDSMRLGREFPKDPADQLIAATARCHGLRLMTADERIQRSGVVALA